MSENWSFETRQIHAGQVPDPTTGARALPIYQTTSYVFNDTDHAANLFALKEFGNIYTRIMNPTTDVVEKRLASLEGGVGGLLTASGQSAETLALLNVAEAGSHIVSSPRLYGGTYNLLHYTFPKLGIKVDFVDDPDDLESWRSTVRPNTKAFFAETISNPKQDILDIENVAALAHEVGVPLIVDNTVATPYLIRPLEWGADIVVHSTTKYLGGHGTAIGGAIIDAGRFDYAADPERFPQFNEPDPSYHGLRYAPDLGVGSALGANLAYILKARVQLLRDLGPAALAVQRLPAVAGSGDTQPADGTAHRQRPAGRRVARRTRRGGERRVRRPADQQVARARPEVRAARRRRRARVRDQGRSAAPASGSSRPWSCTATWRTSATSARWSSTRRRPRTASSARPSSAAPASPRAWSGWLWASSTSMTSWPTWTPASGPPRRPDSRLARRVTRSAGGGSPISGRCPSSGRRSRCPAYGSGTRPGVSCRRRRDNAVLVLHALTGDSHVVGEAGPGHPTPGWWGDLIGPGGWVDTDRWYVVAPNILGGCQGSTGPASAAPDGRAWGSRFPRLTTRDQVAAEIALADVLGIERWALVLGGSAGGMRAVEWAVAVPDRVQRLLLLATTAAASADQIAWCRAQLRAITGDPGLAGWRLRPHRTRPGRRTRGGPTDRPRHVPVGRASWSSASGGRPRPARSVADGGRYAVESYLDHHGDKLVGRFDAGSYVVLTEAMNSHDVGRNRGGIEAALGRITARTVVAGIDSDRLYPLGQSRVLAAAIPTAAPLHVVSSVYGHDGFLIEVDAVGKLVAELLDDASPRERSRTTSGAQRPR